MFPGSDLTQDMRALCDWEIERSHNDSETTQWLKMRSEMNINTNGTPQVCSKEFRFYLRCGLYTRALRQGDAITSRDARGVDPSME